MIREPHGVLNNRLFSVTCSLAAGVGIKEILNIPTTVARTNFPNHIVNVNF